jgi:hypothetical protein
MGANQRSKTKRLSLFAFSFLATLELSWCERGLVGANELGGSVDRRDHQIEAHDKGGTVGGGASGMRVAVGLGCRFGPWNATEGTARARGHGS